MLSFPSNLIVTGSIKPLSSLPQVFRPVKLGPGGMQAAVGIGLALWCMASGCCRHALGGLVAGGGCLCGGCVWSFLGIAHWVACGGGLSGGACGCFRVLAGAGAVCLGLRAQRVRASSSEIYRTGKLQ